MSIEQDTRDIRVLEENLKTLNKKAIPFATRQTLNDTAFYARKKGIEEVDNTMIVKGNKFTLKTILAQKVKGLNMWQMNSSFGSTQEYMFDQYWGFTNTTSSKHGVPLQTGYSAGQEGKNPRTKLARRSMRMVQIRLNKIKRPSSTPQQRNVIAIKKTLESGKKLVFLEDWWNSSNAGSIYKLTGGRLSKNGGLPKRLKVKKVVDLSHKSATVKPIKWMDKPADKAMEKQPEFYVKNLNFQLDRINN